MFKIEKSSIPIILNNFIIALILSVLLIQFSLKSKSSVAYNPLISS
jgi:hypothetical protein